MKVISILIGLLFALSMTAGWASSGTAASEVKIKARYAKNSDMPSLKKFCLHPEKNEHHEHVDKVAPTAKALLIQRLIHAFQQRGYVFTPGNDCELEIGYEFFIGDKKMLHSSRYEDLIVGAEKHGGKTWFNSVSDIPRRAMILHAHDLKQGRTIWMSTAEEIIFDDDQALQSEEAVRERVTYAFAEVTKRIPKARAE